ncbi:MAG: hypothetical protein PHT46_00875 [Candidatus Marinimicrobia bacterium]|nr:hypothetical protein [Candidatus Neomarinimicrobiota bacterium]
MKTHTLILIILIAGLFSCKESLLFPETEGNREYPQAGVGSGEPEFTLLTESPLRIGFNDFARALPIPERSPERSAVYNASAIGDFIPAYTQPDLTDTLDGYVTDNFNFYEAVLLPELLPRTDSLKTIQKYQAVNALTLFIYESYQLFFGDSFYRWGGDITDRDQPQTAESHSTSTKRYGMDCSGFGASPFEAAVLLGILDSTLDESAFSSFGFKHICENDPAVSDGGGREGSTNNYRMEVSDMYKVGTLITTIASGSTPTDAQMAMMQAGDVVLRSGHMGILVEINETLYFLESGGSTVSEDNLYQPYRAKEALADFASRRSTEIRRCLPEKETMTGIVRY